MNPRILPTFRPSLPAASVAAVVAAPLLALVPSGALADPIDPVGIAGSSQFGGREAIHLIDGSGLIDLGGGLLGHVIAPGGNMWLSQQNAVTPFLLVDLGATYAVDSIRIWNYNEYLDGRDDLLSRGVRLATIGAGADLDAFTPVLEDQELAIAPGFEDEDFSETFDLGGVSARFIRIDVLENHGSDFTGLSEVQFDGTFQAPAGDEPLEIVDVFASSEIAAPFDRQAFYAIDGSGLFANRWHNTGADGFTWLSASGDLTPEITFDLGSVQTVGFMKLWNYNENANPVCCLGRGIRQADILVSNDGIDFTPLIEDRLFEIAPGVGNEDFSEQVPIDTMTRFVKIAVDQNHGDGGFTGLSEVRFFAPQEDSDDDLLSDSVEIGFVGNLVDLNGRKSGPGPGSDTGDFDGDGATDKQEIDLGIDPTEPDTDEDGLDDGAELAGAGDRPPTNPRNVDTDGDSLSDLVETNSGTFVSAADPGTDPTKADTDGDGFGDPVEIAEGTDPTDPEDFPMAQLVGLWSFDGDVDPQPDLSGMGNDALVGVGATWVADPDRGGVMEFDGFDSYLEAEDSESLSLTGDFSIAAWINVTDFSNYRGIVGKTAGPGGNLPAGYDWYLVTGSGLSRVLAGSVDGWGTVDAATVPPPLEWHHIAVTRVGDRVTFYLDGEPDGTGLITAPMVDADTPLRIGNRTDLVTPFLGRMDDVAIFSGGLGQPLIQEVMDGNFGRWGIGSQPFMITSAVVNEDGSVTLTFTSRPGASYAVDFATDPGTQWNELTDGVASEGAETSYTDTLVAGTVPRLYYRIRQL